MSEGQSEPTWLNWKIVEAIHNSQILRHGGSHGVNDARLIVSALYQPINRWRCEQPDLFELAAAYGAGLARCNGFEDGNRRTAFLALYTFLQLNGYRLDAPEEEPVRVMTEVAEGTLDEAGLADWARSRSVVVASP